jgi:outer membrane biosynthesis protein TonB
MVLNLPCFLKRVKKEAENGGSKKISCTFFKLRLTLTHRKTYYLRNEDFTSDRYASRIPALEGGEFEMATAKKTTAAVKPAKTEKPAPKAVAKEVAKPAPKPAKAAAKPEVKPKAAAKPAPKPEAKPAPAKKAAPKKKG